MTTDLTVMKLSELEEIVDRGLASFIEVGNALIEIRDGRMYGSEYETFEAYCDRRFGFTRQRAYQLIEATKTVANLSTVVDTSLLPVSERQVRELQNATSDPKAQAKILKKAAKSAPKDTNGKPRITAAAIKKAAGTGIASDPAADRVEQLLGKRPPARATREPGDESETEPQAFKIQRSKTIKTVEALMRAFDDLNGMHTSHKSHRDAITSCKVLLQTAKDWSCK